MVAESSGSGGLWVAWRDGVSLIMPCFPSRFYLGALWACGFLVKMWVVEGPLDVLPRVLRVPGREAVLFHRAFSFPENSFEKHCEPIGCW